MKTKQIMGICALGALATTGAMAQENQSAIPGNLNSNVLEVIKLSSSGFGDEVVLAYATNNPAYYHLSANDMVSLKNAGVSSQVIAAMLQHDQERNATAPAAQHHSKTPSTTARETMATNTLFWVSTNRAPAGTPQNPLLQPDLPPPAPSRGVTVVEQAPPSGVPEVIPVAPGPQYYWTPGYWNWRGTWVWVGGSWVVRPWPGAVWVGGRWAAHGRGRIWIRGRWR